jgi:hypothetical protein
MQEMQAEVKQKMDEMAQRLQVELLAIVYGQSKDSLQKLSRAQGEDAAKARQELIVQKRILRRIEDGQDGDRAAAENRVDELNTKISTIGGMQTALLEQVNTGFGQVLKQGLDHFRELSAQNKENLAEVQRGFKQNELLHDRTIAAVEDSKGDVMGAIEKLKKTSGSDAAQMLNLLQLVLAEVQAKGSGPVTPDIVEAAMAGGV